MSFLCRLRCTAELSANRQVSQPHDMTIPLKSHSADQDGALDAMGSREDEMVMLRRTRYG
jgi:hypothetical protein